MWQSITKDDDGQAHLHDLHGFQLAPSWDEGPQWPVISQGPGRAPAKPRATAQKPAGETVTVVWPDMQIGYCRGPDGQLAATHDEAAIDVALAITKVARPSRVVLLGDNLDLPEFGKYRLSPAFQLTTQAAINYATTLMGRIRAVISADCQIDWIAGNHEERLPNFVMDNAAAAFGLRQGNTPEGWPVLSVPHLCRLDDHRVTYRPGYPASDLWVTPRLRIIHGDRVKSRGSTAHKYLDDEKSSVIYGHIHRIERAHRTRDDHDGPREIMAASPGCLARIDGAVPSTKQGLDLDGRPLTRHEDWQQGLAVVISDDVSGEFDYEQVRIDRGRAWWRGVKYAPEAP
jgi:predicted phosphodiesterase